MSGVAKLAAFYRGYLTAEKSLVPLTILLTTSVALWLLVYLAGAVADAPQGGGAAGVASRPRLSSSSRGDSTPSLVRAVL